MTLERHVRREIIPRFKAAQPCTAASRLTWSLEPNGHLYGLLSDMMHRETLHPFHLQYLGMEAGARRSQCSGALSSGPSDGGGRTALQTWAQTYVCLVTGYLKRSAYGDRRGRESLS